MGLFVLGSSGSKYNEVSESSESSDSDSAGSVARVFPFPMIFVVNVAMPVDYVNNLPSMLDFSSRGILVCPFPLSMVVYIVNAIIINVNLTYPVQQCPQLG